MRKKKKKPSFTGPYIETQWCVKGGHARAAVLSPERRREISQIANRKRWGKRKSAVNIEGKPERLRLVKAKIVASDFHFLADRAQKNGRSIAEEAAIILSRAASAWKV